jgi:TatD DNase family protein
VHIEDAYREPDVSDPNPSAAVQAGAVDSHCHLFLLDGEPADVVESSRAAGVSHLICVGIDPATSHASLELAESFRGVFATAGLHPNSAAQLDRTSGAELEQLVASPLVIGVGETGLDRYRAGAPADVQERVFRLHLALAREAGKPVVVHVRDAWADALRVLEGAGAERVVLHCFSGDERIAAECAARGYFLSFAGNVTYPKNDHLHRAAAAAPLDRILVETDSPFLSPQERRGRDNDPTGVLSVIRTIAEVRGATFGPVRDATSANAFSAFPGLR